MGTLFQLVARGASVVLIAAACGDSGSRAGDSARPAAAGVAPTADSAASGQGGDSYEVTIAGSSRDGTHRGTGSLGCMVHGGLWQAHWEAPQETGLSSLLLQLKSVPASGGTSDKVSFTAVLGSQEDPDGVTAMFDVHGSEFGRDGRGTVTRDGEGATIRIEGTSPQGGRLTAVLRCASVAVM